MLVIYHTPYPRRTRLRCPARNLKVSALTLRTPQQLKLPHTRSTSARNCQHEQPEETPEEEGPPDGQIWFWQIFHAQHHL